MKLEWVCFLNQSGYSQAAQDMIFALHDSGKYNISINPLMSSTGSLSFSKTLASATKKMTKVKHTDPVQVFHCIPDMQSRTVRRSKTIGFATFETFDPPKHWIEILNKNDAIIAPSLFNKKIFEHAGVKKPIFHIPHCIDTKLFNTSVPKKKNDAFTFLFFGTWKKRKGWHSLMEAWITEFGRSDNVKLIIKTDKPNVAKKEIQQHKRSLGLSTKESAPILFESTIFDEVALPRFMRQADCLISPTMGEGFGLPGLQCMALGVPVIITNFSGCKDYANDQTAMLLEPAGFVLLNNMDQIPQFNNKKWAYVPVDSIRCSMRYVVTNADKVKQKADFAATYVADRFNKNVIVNAFDEIMDRI